MRYHQFYSSLEIDSHSLNGISFRLKTILQHSYFTLSWASAFAFSTSLFYLSLTASSSFLFLSASSLTASSSFLFLSASLFYLSFTASSSFLFLSASLFYSSFTASSSFLFQSFSISLTASSSFLYLSASFYLSSLTDYKVEEFNKIDENKSNITDAANKYFRYPIILDYLN